MSFTPRHAEQTATVNPAASARLSTVSLSNTEP